MYREFGRGHFDVSLCRLGVNEDGINDWLEVAYSDGDLCLLSDWYRDRDNEAVKEFADKYELTM